MYNLFVCNATSLPTVDFEDIVTLQWCISRNESRYLYKLIFANLDQNWSKNELVTTMIKLNPWYWPQDKKLLSVFALESLRRALCTCRKRNVGTARKAVL